MRDVLPCANADRPLACFGRPLARHTWGMNCDSFHVVYVNNARECGRAGCGVCAGIFARGRKRLTCLPGRHLSMAASLFQATAPSLLLSLSTRGRLPGSTRPRSFSHRPGSRPSSMQPRGDRLQVQAKSWLDCQITSCNRNACMGRCMRTSRLPAPYIHISMAACLLKHVHGDPSCCYGSTRTLHVRRGQHATLLSRQPADPVGNHGSDGRAIQQCSTPAS